MTVAGAGANNVVHNTTEKGALTVTGGTTLTVTGTSSSTMSVTGKSATEGLKATVNAGASTTSVTVATFQEATVKAGTAKTISVTDTDTADNTKGYVANVTSDADTVTALTSAFDTVNYTATVAQTATLAAAVANKLAITGDVTLKTDDAHIDGKTITGAKKVVVTTAVENSNGTRDYSKVAADFELQAGVDSGDTAQFANGAKVTLTADAGAGTYTVKDAATGKTDSLNFTLNKVASHTTIVTSNVETVNIAVAVDEAVSPTVTDLTVSTLNVGAANTAVVTGTNDISLGNVTAKKVDASALVGESVISQVASGAGIEILGGTKKSTITTTNVTGEVAIVTQDGNDVINLDTGTASSANGAATVVAGNGNNQVTAAALNGGTLVVTAGTGNDVVSIGGSAAANGTVNLNLGAGNNEVTLTSVTTSNALNATITTADGDDKVTMTAVTSADSKVNINLGGGTNTLDAVSGLDLSLGTVDLTGVNKIKVNGTSSSVTATATFQAADISGQAITVTGTGNDFNAFKVVGTTTDSTVDLSTLTIDRAIGTYVNATIIDNSAMDTNATIKGTIVADVITAGDGNDDVTGGKGADVITLGTGADTYHLTAGDTVMTISQGVSGSANSSITGYDTVSGLVISNGTVLSEVLDVHGTASVVANVTAANGNDVTNYSQSSSAGDTATVFAKHTINNGIVTFINSSDASITVSAATLAGAVAYLQGVDLGNAGATVAFAISDIDGSSSAAELMVFTQGSDTGTDNTLDTLVMLKDQGAADALIIGVNTAGSGDLYIM